MTRIPWVGLAALLAMFVIPLLPAWLFEGPRTIRHWPRHHVCGDCAAPWTDGHVCKPEEGVAADRPVRGELSRLDESDAVTAERRMIARSKAR
jgi:hypothetical protein